MTTIKKDKTLFLLSLADSLLKSKNCKCFITSYKLHTEETCYNKIIFFLYKIYKETDS